MNASAHHLHARVGLAFALMIATHAFIPAGAVARAATIATQRTTTDAELVRIDSLIVSNRLAEAGTALDRWISAHPATDPDVSSNDRAYSWLLRARLAQNWEQAEQAYAAIALGYPVSSHAPEALLRLGQGLATLAATSRQSGASRRAVAYLERLVADYPITPFRAAGFLWLARALELDGQRPAACNRLAAARSIQTDSATAALIATESRRLCTDRDP